MGNDIQANLARVESALATPTLTLLDRKSAAIAVPVFMSVFTSSSESVPVDRFHNQVDALLDELRASGYTNTPAQPAKALAAQWVKERWLYRDPGRGEETFRLTSDAEQALDYITRATRTTLNVSASRIETMRRVVADAALAAHPDREERMRRLHEEITRLQAEYDRLADGGELQPANDSELIEQFSNVLRELDGLPVDFLRVGEAVRGLHKRLIKAFREEERPIGEVLDSYLEASDNLLAGTPEGRAFAGALELYRQRDWLYRLREDLTTILDHPAASVLLPDEQQQLVSTVDVIRSGINSVLDQRRRASATLREHIENYDHVRNRELDQVLRNIDTELRTWMQTARARDHVDVTLVPTPLDIEALKLSIFDPDSERAPEPLENVSDEMAAPPTLEEIRQQGGPTLDQLDVEIEKAIADPGGWSSTAAMFNQMSPQMRRPVEALGLLHLLVTHGADIDLDHRAPIETVRPDGSTRHFLMPNARFGTTEGDHNE